LHRKQREAIEAMTKAEIKALERVFAAEIENRLPFQSMAKIFQRLAADGMIEPMERRFNGDSFGPITINGWQLTHLGRLTYCTSEVCAHAESSPESP
jgi:hypothetical protein